MSKYSSGDIRNIVLCGHSGSGKTMLAEAMLFKAGAITRLGSVSEGTTVSDSDPEEHNRCASLSAAVMHASYAGKEFNIISTPGSMEFVGGAVQGLAAADIAVICINAAKGVDVMARKCWDLAGSLGMARVIAITRLDGENLDLDKVLEGVRAAFGNRCLSFTLPDGTGSALKKVTDVLAGGDAALISQVNEAVIESDDTLMEEYMEKGEVPADKVKAAMPGAIRKGMLTPVFALASMADVGVEELMKGVAAWGPSPLDMKVRLLAPGADGKMEETEAAAKEDGPILAQVFKVVSDPHMGKLCFFRVRSGRLEAKASATISSTGEPARFASMFRAQGAKREDLAAAVAGDIACVSKVDALHIGDTITGDGAKHRLRPLPFPTPMASLAVSPKSRNDEQKISGNMQRICDEDPTFIFERVDQTHEHVVRGIGKLHLDIQLKRLKNRFGLEVETRVPKIPYLETITAGTEGSYRHKKQTGGAGQFAEVHLRLKPAERGHGFEFVDAIVGGVISNSFIPSVEKGVRAALDRGPVAGFPVVDVIVELFYGKEHPVDSKDIAFQTAGRQCFAEQVQNCRPVLLEPIVNIEIGFPSKYFGDISGDMSQRRGRPTGTDQLGDIQVLKGQVPLAEVIDYGATLNALTQGEGFYGIELSHYEVVPPNITQQVAAKMKQQEEK